MTQTQQHCSTNDQLLTFLRGQLRAQEESELQLHLNDCVLCRERLESAAADANAWNEAKQFFGIGALQTSSDVSTSSHEEATQGSQRIRQVLDELGPTDDPESLGRIGGYEVTGVVGAGGMGVVLKAHDRSLDRIVAIKVMSPHLASSGSARKRFAREAKAAAAVLHPNVIAIHGVASDDACPYLVMPYVRGASLQKRIDSQGPLPLKDTLRIGSQIAAGLAAAHEQGLVHRDIKPANILLEEGVERVTITDFGLARAVDDASMTCSGVIAGTPQYMSPEQTRGEPIDARSDLFSLGSVLYAMCAGRSPFRAETTYGVLYRIANDNPTPACEVNSDVPVWLGHIVERLMAKRAEDRFESAAQVAALLEGCLAHVQQPTAIPLPVGVQALAAQSQLRAGEIPKPNRLKAIHQRIPPIGKFIAAAAGAIALFFAGVLIVLELDKGTLTIESEIDDVPIRIMQGDEVVKSLTVSKEGATTRIGAGKYIVEIGQEFDKAVVKDGSVELSRGATAIIKVTRINADTAESEKAKDEAAKAWLRRPVGGSTHDGKRFQLAGHDALMHCVMTNNAESLNRLLTMDKYDLDLSPGNGQWTLLQTALQHNCVETTSLLLRYGANPSFAGKGTPLPLELAKRSGRKELVALVQEFLELDDAHPQKKSDQSKEQSQRHSVPDPEKPNAPTSSANTDGATELEGVWHLESAVDSDGTPRKLELYDHWTFRGHRLLCEFATAGHWACDVEVDSTAKTIRYLKDRKDLLSNADYVLDGDQLTIYEHPPQKKIFRRGRALIPVALKTQRTVDALVAITFSGTIDGAPISASGIGWMVDDEGHILLPSHVVSECNDEAIELRYASGAHGSARRLKTLGHLTLLKSDQVVKGPAISLNSVTSLASGDSVSAILNGTDNIPGSISSARTSIVLSQLESVKIDPVLRFQNVITTDFVADDSTLSGAPLLTKSGDVAGMMIRFGSSQLIAIPVAEILVSLEQLQEAAKSDTIRDHGLSTDSIEVRTDGRFGIIKTIEPTSLNDAVTKFNQLAKEHILGRTQPELTVDEMTAALRLWLASNECTESTRKDFQQVLDSQMLRPGHILQFNTEFETDGHLFEVWSIQYGDDKSSAWFKIRDTKLLSRLKTDEERKAWEQRIDQMKKSFREYKRRGDTPKAYDTNPIGPAQTSSSEVALGEGTDIAELLETAAKHEEWVSKIGSVHFRAKGKNVQSEKALEVERAKLIARGADAVVPIKSPSLLPSFEFSDEVAWNGKQVANIRKYSLGLDDSHWVWNGTQFTSFRDGPAVAYLLDNEAPIDAKTPLAGSCHWPFDPRFELRTAPTDDLNGFQPNEFTLHTPDLFHGVRCHRLVSLEKQLALFIAVDSGLMIGKREGILTEPIVPILKSLGHDVKNADEARKLLSELEPAQLLEVRRAGEQLGKKFATDTLLNGPTLFETWVSDFQPTPLGVFPMKHYQRVSGVDADVAYESYRIESEVVELKANEPIDSTLFQIEFRDGVAVVDNRFETPITYSYDSKMTSEDLKALVQKSLESVNELDALVGKPLPVLTNLSWINSESRDNASFNGRPLIVECWAVGCGPCRSHFATLNSVLEAGKIQVLGFHTATKDVEEITKFAQDQKLGYPIVVDTGDDSKNAFGPLPVTRMPYTILVDASGTIIAHGNLETLLPKAFEMVATNKPVAAQRSETLVTVPPMEFDTLEDFLKPGRELFDKEMKQIDERLAKVVEGSAEHSLLTTKKKQLQQQWDLSVAQVKGMAAAAKTGKPVQLAPIVIPNNSRPWQAPMPDPLLGHDEDIAKVLEGAWQLKRFVVDREEIPFQFEGSTVNFSKNMMIIRLKSGDKKDEMQMVYRIGNDKIDVWDLDSGSEIRTALPYLGSYSIENDTLRICYHDSEMELETPQSRPPVQPGKRLIYLELQRDPIAEKVEAAKGKTDDLRSGQSYKIKLLVLASDDLKPVSGATVDVTLIEDYKGVTGDGGFADFKTDEDGIAIIDKSLWPGRYQIQVRAPKGSRYRDTEFSKEESLLVVHEDGRYSPREFRLAVDENKSPK